LTQPAPVIRCLSSLLLPEFACILPHQNGYLINPYLPKNRIFQCPAQSPRDQPPSPPTSSNSSPGPPSPRSSLFWPHPPLRPGGLRVPRALHLDHQHHRGRRLHALRARDHAPEDRRGGRKPAGLERPLCGGDQRIDRASPVVRGRRAPLPPQGARA